MEYPELATCKQVLKEMDDQINKNRKIYLINDFKVLNLMAELLYEYIENEEMDCAKANVADNIQDLFARLEELKHD